MHFSLPYAEELNSSNGKKFQVYKVFVNGVLHCSPRYSDFLRLSEELRRDLTIQREVSVLPPFPPKRLLTLTVAQIDERRRQLERYLQAIASHPKLVKNETFMNFLFTSHEKYMDIMPKLVMLDVYLMNGNKLTVQVFNNERVLSVMDKFVCQIRLNPNFTDYFGLFLMRKEVEGEISVIRRIQSFEAPYLSLEDANVDGLYKLVIRKSFWNAVQEDEIIEDPIAVNLLYLQAVSDVDRGWIEVPDETRLQQLNRLRQNGSKKEFLCLCRTLRFYGYLHIRGTYCSWPRENTQVEIAVGPQSVILQYVNDVGGVKQETAFDIIRIRTWCITTTCEHPGQSSHFPKPRRQSCPLPSDSPIHPSSTDTLDNETSPRLSLLHPTTATISSPSQGKRRVDVNSLNVTSTSTNSYNWFEEKRNSQHNQSRHELAFEYLFSAGELQWIHVSSDTPHQIILLSMSLQSVVDELLRTRQGNSLRRESDRLSHPKRDESIIGTVASPITGCANHDSKISTKRSAIHLGKDNPINKNQVYCLYRSGIGDQDL